MLVLCVKVAEGFQVGDRVSSPHADVVSAPRNLCAKIPDTVSMMLQATVLTIGLQGIRLAKPHWVNFLSLLRA